MSDTNQPSHRSHKFAIVMTLFSVAIAVLLLLNRQFVIDQISVWQYRPSEQIVALADRGSMNENGKFYFYASHPALESTQDFNQKCDRKEQATAILGCYNGRYIYVYNVTDAKLDGIREVTAAHEMLHAAYDRLNESERRRIGALLEVEYNKLKDDKKLAERMAFYARTEPGERENELHSVIGTEISAISSELEAHYKRYFTDRTQVVALHSKYEGVFKDLQARSDSLSAQLTRLGDSIEADSTTYNKAVNQLNADIESFNTRAKSGGFSSQGEFQAARNALTSRADQLDATRDAINSKVMQYEALRQELLAIASQSEALNRSIDSSLAPAPNL